MARALGALCVALLCGCSLAAAVDDATDGGTPAFATPACQVCVDQACAAEAVACEADPGCRPIGRCLAALAPDDVVGRGACEETHASALDQPAWKGLDGCLRGRCADPCLGRRGLFADYSESCQACLQASQGCGESLAACVRNGDCERAYRYCFASGRQIDPTRVLECFFDPADAEGATDDLEHCVDTCPAECPVRRDFACTGQYAWSLRQDSPTHRYRAPIQLLRFGALEPAVGLRVEVCAPATVPCDVLSSVTLDDSAVFDVELPRFGSRGFSGYLRATGEVGGHDVSPTYMFLGHPIGRDELFVPLYVLLEEDLPVIARVGGAEIAPGLGTLIVGFYDCTWYSANGVQLDIDAAARVVDAAEPLHGTRISYAGGGDVTVEAGPVVAFNVKPGCVELVGVVDGRVTHRQRVQVFADAVTIALALPLTMEGESAFDCTPAGP